MADQFLAARAAVFAPPMVMSGGRYTDRRYGRVLDLSVLLFIHIVLAPVFLAAWLAVPLAIWLCDRGPVFYRQPRLGKAGRPFSLLKFRTMVVDAEKIGPHWTADADPRITPVGRFLRRFGIDEFPQVINILRGEMRFVGPRPIHIKHHLSCSADIPHFADRLAVRPGLSGLAQVYLLRNCQPRARYHYDMLYIRNASLWRDIRIIGLSAADAFTMRLGDGHRRPGRLSGNQKSSK